MKIVSLKAENFKRLKAIEVRPDPKQGLVRITGKNDQGKSSLLDSIAVALAGADAIPLKPIRNGEARGEVVLELDDLVVKRTFTEKGTQLVVMNREGAKYPSPQAMLDRLVGKLTFDPLAFSRMDPRKQSETLRQLLGLDFTEIDMDRKAAYDNRTEVGRALKQLEAQIEGIQVPDDAPDEEVNPAEIMRELEEAQEANAANAQKRLELDRMHRQRPELTDEIERLKAALQQAQDELVELDSAEGKLAEEIQQLVDVDTDAIRQRLSNIAAENANARNKVRRQELEASAKRGAEEWQGLTKKIKELDDSKARQIAQADMPVDGLSLNEEGVVLYKGIPLSQASSSGQLRVSVAMAMAMNPQLRVIRISDGSLLDSDSLKVIEDMATTGDYQIWIEMVDESGGMGIVIEDGMVRGAASKPAEKPEVSQPGRRTDAGSEGEHQCLL